MVPHFSAPAQFDSALKPKTRLLPRLAALCGLALSGALASAQTAAPIVLPNTFTTVAGSSNGAAGVTGFTVGSACSPGSPYKATDVYGNGCLATQAVFGTDLQDGLRVDGQGNIYIADINNNWANTSVVVLRRVDSRSGVISLLTTSITSNCALATATTAGSMDSQGDGCAIGSSKAPKERGWGMDPYGNLFAGSYSSGEVHVYCNAVSPLCPIAAGVTQTYSSAQKQVGNVYRIAACVATGTSATASSAGSNVAPSAGDGYFASAFWNLPGDIAAWGASNSAFNTTATATGVSGTCSATMTGEINGVRSVTADQYGNVFISDGTDYRVRVIVGPATYTLQNGTVLTNPIPAVLALYPAYSAVAPAQMYGRIYPMVGGFAASTAGSPCASLASANSADAYGDGCPWFNTAQGTSNPVGLTMDSTTEGGIVASNLVLQDGGINSLRVLYMGPTVAVGSITAAAYPMANAIFANNQTITSVTHGSVYLLAGNNATAVTATPAIGTGSSVGSFTRVSAGPNGNLYLGKNSSSTVGSGVGFYDLSTGYLRLLVQSSVPVAASVIVVPGTTATATSICTTPGTGDGQPAFATATDFSGAALTTNGCFNNSGTGSSQLTITADSNNNLYIGDVEIDSAGYGRTRIRELLASQLFPTTLGTPFTQTLFLHGPAGVIAPSATAIAASALEVSPAEIAVATPTCAAATSPDQTQDCLANVTFSPQAPGLRSGSLALSQGSVTSNLQIFGVGTGSALVTDPASNSAALTTSLAAPGAAPAGVAVDSAGDVFTIDTAAGKFTEISGATRTQLAGTPPANPTQLALDLAGNLYAAGTGAATLTKLTLKAGAYTASTVAIAGVATPQAVTVDQLGNLYVADKTNSAVYKVAAATLNGSTFPGNTGVLPNYTQITAVATGLASPTSLALDLQGDLYIGDTGVGSIFRVDAKTGALTTLLTGIHPLAVSTDAAGDVYYQDTTSLAIVEIPFSSIASGVAGTQTVTVLSALTRPSGLAVAGNGNVYSADSGAGTLKLINRSALAFNFGTGSAGSPTLAGTLGNTGNLAAAGTAPVANSTNIVLTGTGANACSFTSDTLGPQASGAACGFSASFVGQGTATINDTVNYVPAVSTVGTLSLTGVLTSISGTTTTLSGVGATVLPGSSVTLTATVASTAAVSGQTVTFYNGTTVLATATTNAAGVATYPFTAGSLGTVYNLSASFTGTSLLGPSTSAIKVVTVALTPSAIILALSTSSTFPNQPVILTATQTPAAAGQTINFLSGTTVLGTGVISAAGVATYTFTPTTGGTYLLTASFPSDGKVYAASVSAAQTLLVSAGAVVLTASPSTLAIAAGASAQINLSLTAAGGYNGLVTLGCSSPVAYVTCALSFQSVAVSSGGTAATITVAPTTSALDAPSRNSYAALLIPFGALALGFGLRKRGRGLAGKLLLLILVVGSGALATGITGCSTSNAAAHGPAPTGTQVVTFTAMAGGGTQSSSVTVTIQ